MTHLFILLFEYIMCLLTKKQKFFINNDISKKEFSKYEIDILLSISNLEIIILPINIKKFINKVKYLIKINNIKTKEINKNDYRTINTIISLSQLSIFLLN